MRLTSALLVALALSACGDEECSTVPAHVEPGLYESGGTTLVGQRDPQVGPWFPHEARGARMEIDRDAGLVTITYVRDDFGFPEQVVETWSILSTRKVKK